MREPESELKRVGEPELVPGPSEVPESEIRVGPGIEHLPEDRGGVRAGAPEARLELRIVLIRHQLRQGRQVEGVRRAERTKGVLVSRENWVGKLRRRAEGEEGADAGADDFSRSEAHESGERAESDGVHGTGERDSFIAVVWPFRRASV